MKFSLIVPIKNNEETIAKILSRAPREKIKEVILVDKGSSEQALRKIKKSLKHSDRLIKQKGKGWGSAYLEGIDAAKGDFLILMDGNGSQRIEDVEKIIDKAERGYDFVSASRYAPGGRGYDDVWIRWFGNRMLTWLTKALHGTNLTDALFFYYGITKAGYNKLTIGSQGYDFGIEFIVKAHRAGLKFAEVPAIEKKSSSRETLFIIAPHGINIIKMILRRYKD